MTQTPDIPDAVPARENIAASDAMPRSSEHAGAWKHYALVAALAGVILLWNLPAESFDDHEAHAALTARTMSDANAWLMKGAQAYPMPPNTPLNHWLVPIENGRPRLVKTPLPYWIITLIAKSGLGVTEFSARLPSALAAMACALVLLAAGRRMLSSRAALLGTLMFVTSVGFQRWGRNARPEMMLCLWMTTAMACFYLGVESPSRRGRTGWMIAFWLAMGMGNLSKEFVPLLLAWPLAAYLCFRRDCGAGDDGRSVGRLRAFVLASVAGLLAYYAVLLTPALHWWRPAGVGQETAIYLTMAACLGLPMAWYFLANRAWREAGPLLPTAIPGAIVMLAMFVPWMWYMHRLFPGVAAEVFSEQVTERAAGTGRWLVDPPDAYLRAMGLFPLPWLALVPGAFAVGLMKRFDCHRRGLVFLTLWCAGILILFLAAAGKREHYIFPCMPALCLLMGSLAEDVVFEHRWISPAWARLLGGGYGVAAAGAVVAMAVAWIRFPQETKWPWFFAMAACGAVPAIAAGVLAVRGRLRPLMGLLLASMLLMYLFNGSFCSRWDDYRPAADFFQTVGAKVPANEALYHWTEPQPQAPFYVGRDLPAAQWPFDVVQGQVGKEQAQAMFHQWLRDANNAPWMLGYAQMTGVLGAAGYRPTDLRTPPITRKNLEYVLFHRSPTPATMPATAKPE